MILDRVALALMSFGLPNEMQNTTALKDIICAYTSTISNMDITGNRRLPQQGRPNRTHHLQSALTTSRQNLLIQTRVSSK